MTDPYHHVKQIFTQRKINILGSGEQKQYAVMLPLLKQQGEVHVLFQVRSQLLNTQPGEICFPGGKIDKTDSSNEAAARRELCEELGLTQDQVETIAPLDYLVTPFRGIIYPFVGIIKSPDQINVNKAEVDSVFTISLSELLNMNPDCYQMELHVVPEERFPFHLIPNQDAYQKRIGKLPQYFFHYKEHVIWGLTALILKHFISCMNKK